MPRPEKHLYMVVCKNEKQAKDLFERLFAYWKSRCGRRNRLCVSPNIHAICDPCDAVVCVPERKMFYASSLHRGTTARLYNGDYVDRWLREKENDDG